MTKALKVSRVGVSEMAAYLGVSRTSVSNWINGRVTPSVQTLRLWAMRTGVQFEWLAGDQFPRRINRSRKAPFLTLAPFPVTAAAQCLAA